MSTMSLELARPRALIRQEDTCGCVLACLAMVLDRTYDEVRSEIGAPDRGLTHDTWQGYLTRKGYATQLVFEYDPIAKQKRTPWPLRPWASLHLCAVDAGRGPGSHQVVITREGVVFDPMADQLRRMLDYRGFSYMAALFLVGSRP